MEHTAEITKVLAQQLLPARRYESSKRDYGRVLIVAGTEGMMGAAVLCARAALRTGAGLVTLCCPRSQFVIPQTAVPEVMCVPQDLSVLTGEYLSGFTAIAFGPGCLEKKAGKDPLSETADAEPFSFSRLLSRILKSYEGILVVDASGLDLLHDLEDLNQDRPQKCRLIVTPHCAEAARLLDAPYAAVKANRNAAALALAERYRAVSLVKGPHTKVAPACGEGALRSGVSLYTNTTGNSGMATGGAGDVLTGIIAGLAAQLAVSGFADEPQNGKISPATAAAMLGVYLHGLSGDKAAEEVGRYSLTAGDLISYLPQAFNFLTR